MEINSESLVYNLNSVVDRVVNLGYGGTFAPVGSKAETICRSMRHGQFKYI